MAMITALRGELMVRQPPQRTSRGGAVAGTRAETGQQGQGTTGRKPPPRDGNGPPRHAVLRAGQQGSRLVSRAASTMTAPPPPLSAQRTFEDPEWSSPVESARRVFCNRSLNMRSIRAIGYDMDYTLAQYKEETFEMLAYTETVKKLVEAYGYPEEVRGWSFDPTYMVRGLVIDKRRGHILKMDRHKYVKLARHGFTELSAEERRATYGSAALGESFDGGDYANIDTLFSLAEAYLFCQLVELKDASAAEGGTLLADKSYFDLYTETRYAVDLCHRDGSLKIAVAKDPAKYIHKDDSLLPLLQMQRASGRKTFIVTNSLYDYTNVVMNYLLEGRTGKNLSHDWLKYFDVVIVGSRKPVFFTDGPQLFEIDLPTGLLHNTDNGSPLVQLDGDQQVNTNAINPNVPEMLRKTAAQASDGAPLAHVFQNGSYRDLHAMLGVASGSEVLYAGDHIYGDVLKSKKALGWRTLLIVPELECELATLSRPDMRGKLETFRKLRETHATLEDVIDRITWDLKTRELDFAQRGQMEEQLQELQEEREHYRARHRTGLREYHETFHPVWGQITLTGYQSSRFAHQIERFACLYTSHVTNLINYSPNKSFRCKAEVMPHGDIGEGFL